MNEANAYEQYERLIPIARLLYEHTSQLSYEMLLPLFLLSVAIGYTSDLGIAGSVLVRLKRLILVGLLLAIFPRVAEFSQVIGVEIATSIDDMTGIDMLLEAASKNSSGFSQSAQKILNNFTGSMAATALFYATYFLLVFARMFLLAFQHFYWFLLVAIAPFLILGTLFEASTALTKGLFKNLFQVASWPIIWSILSAFVKALPFSLVYGAENEDIVAIAGMNLLFAVALLFTPLLVSQLTEGVTLSVGSTLKNGVLNTVALATGPKGLIYRQAALRAATSAGRRVTSLSSKFKS
jgi:magnesium-transporting ATPase (P-type)